MRFGRGSRSALAFYKRLQTLRVPAGDPSPDCMCPPDHFILTEDGRPILAEDQQGLTTES